MATWKISNEHQKNVIEYQTFTKNGVHAQKSQCYTWGTWTCQSDTKPEIDLVNRQTGGFDETTGGYNWQMLTVVDKDWIKWGFSSQISEEEQTRIKSLWESGGDQSLENDGFVKSGPTYKVHGYLKLVNQDTNEQWLGSDLA
jgi:hypothetical protein